MVRTITGDKLDKVGQYSLTDLELISYQFEKEESLYFYNSDFLLVVLFSLSLFYWPLL